MQKIQSTLQMTIDELQDELTRKEVCLLSTVCFASKLLCSTLAWSCH